MSTPVPESPAIDTPKQRRQRPQIIAMLGLSLLMAAALAAAIAYQQGMFGSHVKLYFIAEDVTGLAPGTTVRMSGFRIGKLETLELQPDHTVRVTLSINEDLFAGLRSDARAVVVREQLKPAAIDLKPGSAPGALSIDNPRLAYQRRGTLTDIADDLRSRLAPILDDIRQISGVARERKGDLDAILHNTQTITAALATTSQNVQALSAELRQRASGLGGQSEQAMQQANRSLVKLDGLLVQADTGLTAVNSKLPGLLEKTDRTMSQLETVMRDARTITAAAAAGLPPLLRTAPPLVEESREMLQGLRDAWPMRVLLPAPPPPLLPIDSHDAATARDPGAR